MNTIQNDTERLKKELWHLKKVTLPNLEERISAGGGGSPTDTGEIQNQINNIKTRLESLEAGFSGVSNGMETNATAIGELDGQISQLQATQSSQGESISTLTTSLGEIAAAQTSCTERMTTIESTQTTHTQDYEKLKRRVDIHDVDLQYLEDQTDIALMLTDDNLMRIIDAEEMIGNIRKQLQALEGNTSGGGDTSALEARISTLEGKVSTLETTIASHTATLALIDEDMYLIKGMLGI